jgi:hypothetical protein
LVSIATPQTFFYLKSAGAAAGYTLSIGNDTKNVKLSIKLGSTAKT